MHVTGTCRLSSRVVLLRSLFVLPHLQEDGDKVIGTDRLLRQAANHIESTEKHEVVDSAGTYGHRGAECAAESCYSLPTSSSRRLGLIGSKTFWNGGGRSTTLSSLGIREKTCAATGRVSTAEGGTQPFAQLPHVEGLERTVHDRPSRTDWYAAAYVWLCSPMSFMPSPTHLGRSPLRMASATALMFLGLA